MRELRKETEILSDTSGVVPSIYCIRNERTPKGDGNLLLLLLMVEYLLFIRNERTPKGDGNALLTTFDSVETMKIRNERTPKGDGNNCSKHHYH